MNTFFIAEAGVNHNGSFELACKLVDAAVKAGANAVKFQTFKADKLVLKHTPKAEYQKATTAADESQYAMLKRLELSFEQFKALKGYCEAVNIEFMSTGFDADSVAFLQSLNLSRYKIPSGELTNSPLVHQIASYRKPMIVSTGMATLGDIEFALAVIFYALTQNNPPENKADILRCYSKASNRNILSEYVTLLHCTSSYPTLAQNVNLNAMQGMAACFGLDVGYSDHTLGYTAALAAVAKGAKVIEKHFTLDKSLPGPDHKASLDTEELASLIARVRELEHMLGDGRKMPTYNEYENQQIARQRLVTLKPVKKGEVLTVDSLGTRRSLTGLAAELYWDVLGTKAEIDYQALESICSYQLNP